VDGFLSVGLGSRPTLRPGGPVVVPLEACYRTRLRSGKAVCYSVLDEHGFFGDDPVGQAGGLVHEVWSAGWLRLALFSSNISWGAIRDPPQGPTGDVRQHDFPVCPSVDSVAEGGYLGDEDLGRLFESLGGVVTERTLGRLHAVQLLAREDVYYVDLGQWTVALGGAEAEALIPVICGVLLEREVLVPLSGITVAALYEELAVAIKSQSVPRRIFPLRWSFKTIVGAYNNFPEMDALYSFREAVQPIPLNHGRRVLLWAMFLRGQAWELDLDWRKRPCCLVMNWMSWTARAAVLSMSCSSSSWVTRHDSPWARAPARTW
jgi:hypothetical protein